MLLKYGGLHCETSSKKIVHFRKCDESDKQ